MARWTERVSSWTLESRVPRHLHPSTAQRSGSDLPSTTRRGDHGVCDREPKAGTTRCGGGPVEPLQDAFALALGNSRPAVIDGQHGRPARVRYRQLDLPASAGITAGVVDKNRHEAVEPFGWRVDRHVLSVAGDT